MQIVNLLDLIRALEGSVDHEEAWSENLPWNEGGAQQMIDKKLDDCIRGWTSAGNMWDGAEQRAPIVVCVNGNEDYCKGRKWILGNGNHRFATLVALAAEEVMVVFTESYTDFMVAYLSEA